MTGDIQLATEAAQCLFNEPKNSRDIFEPSDERTAQAAVRRLGELFDQLPGTAKIPLERARNSGDLVSSDQLQGLAEIVQNADDVKATEVRFLLTPTELLVSHNGNPLNLRHVLALATPFITTKDEEAELMGRFGIGLTTLKSLSETLEVFCQPYNIRLGDPFVSPIIKPLIPDELNIEGWTTFRIPLTSAKVELSDLSGWLTSWDESAMLFLGNVSRISLRSKNGEIVNELTISRDNQVVMSPPVSSSLLSLYQEKVTSRDERSWIVYRAEYATPRGLTRAHKATESNTSIGIALPLHEVEQGKIHAGLPVASTGIGVFANAQFDTTTSRQGFPDNEWNNALIPLLAELWTVAVLDAFDRDARSAWQAIPFKEATDENSHTSVIRKLETEILSRARHQVAYQLALPVAGNKISLQELAVEVKSLEHVLSPVEIAELAGLDETLPMEVRDGKSRWRKVLRDWRNASTDIPPLVTVDQAIALLKNEDRPPENVIELCAVGLKKGLDEQLLELPCMIASDDRRLKPPLEDSPEALAIVVSPLAKQLGIITLLHPAHLNEEPNAQRVLEWIRERGALVDGANDLKVVERLAVAGRSDKYVPRFLQIEQLQALRSVFEEMEPQERERLGPDVGNAIELEAYQYEIKGRKKVRRDITARALKTYLPRTIEGENRGFAVAADKTPGIIWINGLYARHLRSARGRQGVGAQRFLRLLGAETAPRILPHPQLKKVYSTDPRLALPASIEGGVQARTDLLRQREANYSIDDFDSPVLEAVARDIARVRNGPKRRKRATALVSTLARAWDRLGDRSHVQSAYAYHRLIEKGFVPALWLWRARDIAWLDDERGKPRLSPELRVRTEGTEAVYGADPSNYLHSDLFSPNWQPVLSAMDVSGNPTRKQLVERLKELRTGTQEGTFSVEDANIETAIVYKTLARSLEESVSRSDLSKSNLREEFSEGKGLIFTALGWRTTERVFGGDPIFGRYEAFAPAVNETGELWKTLGLNTPSVMDCVKVIRKISNRFPVDPSDTVILLETLRVIASEYSSSAKEKERRALRELPLLTSKGWVRQRPIYATNDPLLADGLACHIPIWKPGGDLGQFSTILGALRVRPIDATNSAVLQPELAEQDLNATEFFQAAIQQLHNDLARNEPDLKLKEEITWDSLKDFKVCVHHSLALCISISSSIEEQYKCKVAVKVDVVRGQVFVRTREYLNSVDCGRALATLFDVDEQYGRSLAYAWLGACERARGGRPITILELAKERAAREERERDASLNKENMEKFRKDISRRHRTNDSNRGTEQKVESETQFNIGEPGKFQNGNDLSHIIVHRVLVDPNNLRLCDPKGHVTDKTKSKKNRSKSGDQYLVEPKGPAPARTTKPPASYTSNERERIGMDLLEKVLCSDLVDVRARRRVGADALDEEKRPYELKVFAESEPDEVSLTEAEVRLAIDNPDFMLVVVSGVEGVDARPTVRLILDPLRELKFGVKEKINLSGVKSSQNSLLYKFEPGNGTDE